jgi:hypothetical protein
MLGGRVKALGGRVGLRRLSVGALLCLVVWAAPAQSAVAHGALPHYATVITSIEPAVPGVHIEAAPDGRYLSITNPTRRTVVVLGHDHEPYLRITAHDVSRNVHSPTGYLNTPGPTPAGVDANALPEWEQVSTSNTSQFRDDDIRWTGSSRPPVVDQSPNKLHLIRNWTVDILVDGTPVTISGTLSWHPGNSPTSLVAFAVVCVILLVGFVVLLLRDERRNRARGRSRGSSRVDAT